ncbi:MAG: hypothetical protein J1G05_06030 [Clostridiales bacterium]|nr:hypothetical protein [Clostridiales bacterium]
MSRHEVKSLKYNLISGGLPLGCKVKNGIIFPAYSVGEAVSCPKNVRYATYVHYSNKLYLMDTYSLYSAVEGGDYNIVVTEDAKLPFVIEYREGTKQVAKAIFDKTAVLFRDAAVMLRNVPYRICGGVYKNGRVFAIDGTDSFKLCWSGESGIDDWEEKIDGAGWLYTDTELGEIINLLVYKDYIAVIKKRGISLLSAFGTPEDFKVITTVSTPMICRNCSVVCGDKIYFYTADGLYTFNGSAIKKVEIELAKDFTSVVYAMAYGSTVFIAGKHEKLYRNVILAYETHENIPYFIDVAATAMAAASHPYAYAGNSAIRLEKGKTFTYRSDKIGHFSRRQKTLKSVFVDCENEVEITVFTENRKIDFKNIKGKLSANIRGMYFKVYVTGTDAEIKQFTANLEYY